MHLRASLFVALFFVAALARGQAQAPAAERPIPDVAELLHSVENNQAALDRAREEYTFRQQQRLTFYNKHGQAEHTDETVSHVFFVHGHPIETLISKNGRPLSAGDLKKEQDRATKEARKYEDQPYGAMEKNDVTVSQLLAVTHFDHPRRIFEEGRPVIVVNFVGDPHAKSHGRQEDAIKKVRGTMWIDEDACEVRRMQATFDQPIRLGFGLLASVDPGSHFEFEQALIRNEAWLPTRVDGRFDGRAALFVGFHVALEIRYDQYEKFSASAVQQTAQPH